MISTALLQQEAGVGTIAVEDADGSALYLLNNKMYRNSVREEWMDMRTVIKGTKTISEYLRTKATMELTADEMSEKHKASVDKWTHGSPVKVWFDPFGNLCIEYWDGECWHYDKKGKWWQDE